MAPLDPMRSSNTYMDIVSIAHEIEDISASTSEGHVNGVWQAILDWVFPSTEGYITRAQAQHTAWGGRRGFSDFHTFEWDDTTKQRIFFLVTQCKPQRKEGQDSAWQDGANQLGGYLRMQHGTRPTNERRDVYLGYR
ncbi:hypothetical protein P170DRAFT_477263 [Aspergillus steynii IBT 23096]|uniref:Uncharacterized protein n=1 Tax=Aspergillus steynii IBT 23096 TaxID=1392250 RepID=A0A2I2G0H3_9EURO|nr:uncharacterized protein P170DRAFT_477263 [Aspergillus steynii IBT 23096]PLB46384.1 hypothetical protein P170DRAFT_477263 [Aspergillus steynii IBT 23096]